MPSHSELTTRNAAILHAIVGAHIESGEPVASKAIARGGATPLSSASVRNIMAELCEQGFLSQPHTSAGRVPTAKAYESYARSLNSGRLVRSELERLKDELARPATIEARIMRTSHVLTEMTRGVGIAASIPASIQRLDQVELLALTERRVLMMVVTADHVVRQQVVTLDQPVTPDELQSIRGYVNRNFSGWKMDDARRELERRLENERAVYSAMQRTLAILYDRGLLDMGLKPEVHMEGAANLVGFDLHLTRERMRDLFRALEEKRRILELLNRFLERSGNTLTIRVGLGEMHPAMAELALVGTTVRRPSGLSTKVAVLGPMRMPYGRVIAAVQHVSAALQEADQ
jgi:heat-inducible transcriptional repressor